MKTTVANENKDLAPSLASQFEAQITKRLDDPVGPNDEIEYKSVMDFSSVGSDKEFMAKHGLKYPSQIIYNALVSKGICFIGDSEEPHTKNLVSYYYDTATRALNALGISLRMRHEEKNTPIVLDDEQSLEFEPTEPDLSFKIPTQEGDTTNRLEYEVPSSFRSTDQGFRFTLTFAGLVEKYAKQFLDKNDPRGAVQWVNAVQRTFGGFDWGKFREHFSINCKRTQPFAVFYSFHDHEGKIVRDEDGGVLLALRDPSAENPNDILTKEERIKGYTARRIVYQFCLDTNRFFAIDPKNPSKTLKYGSDHEVEYELQTKTCDYTRNAIASTKGITFEEAYAARRCLEDLVSDTYEQYGVTRSPMSGKSKQYRGFHYIDEYNKNNDAKLTTLDELTVRGRKDLHIVKAHSWNELLDASPSLRKAVDNMAGNDNKRRYTA